MNLMNNVFGWQKWFSLARLFSPVRLSISIVLARVASSYSTPTDEQQATSQMPPILAILGANHITYCERAYAPYARSHFQKAWSMRSSAQSWSGSSTTEMLVYWRSHCTHLEWLYEAVSHIHNNAPAASQRLRRHLV